MIKEVIKCSKYRHPSVSTGGNGSKAPPQVPKSEDAEVPYVNGREFSYALHTSPGYLKPSLDYL